ncbi:hypothetical protein [Streptomyces roseolus]|uniref:hypothetical protein n=1 Tax=Streptomyces roseolus TaxID=67358 RepID=UPI00364C5E3C
MKEHVGSDGRLGVEEGPDRLRGDRRFSDVGRTNTLVYSLVDRPRRSAERAAGATRKITPRWLRHFFASAGLSKGVPVAAA